MPRELSVYELVPCQWLPLETLHEFDLAVNEDCLWVKRVLLRERVRRFLFERMQPRGVYSHFQQNTAGGKL